MRAQGARDHEASNAESDRAPSLGARGRGHASSLCYSSQGCAADASKGLRGALREGNFCADGIAKIGAFDGCNFKVWQSLTTELLLSLQGDILGTLFNRH